MSDGTNLNTTLDNVFRATSSGATSSSIGSVFYGINHRQTPEAVPINRDTFGLTLFVRPQLNFSTQNLRAERKLLPLLTQEARSIQRIIRYTLDPRYQTINPDMPCPHVDPRQAFIPLLSNHLVSCSGWPDTTLDTYTSKPGAYKEVFSIPDGTHHLYGAYDLSCSFRNMVGDPISKLIQAWIVYMSNVFEGIMMPYIDFITENELDYVSRIYRLVLDVQKRYVQKIGATGYCFPASLPDGASFNFEADKPINSANDQLQLQMRCVGATYNDPILFHEFNRTVEIFNPSMKDETREILLTKIDHRDLSIFNGRGYPRIDPDTKELQWWITKDIHARVISDFERHYNALNTSRP